MKEKEDFNSYVIINSNVQRGFFGVGGGEFFSSLNALNDSFNFFSLLLASWGILSQGWSAVLTTEGICSHFSVSGSAHPPPTSLTFHFAVLPELWTGHPRNASKQNSSYHMISSTNGPTLIETLVQLHKGWCYSNFSLCFAPTFVAHRAKVGSECGHAPTHTV